MTYLDFLEQKVLLERLVIGLEEPVLIKGLGELSAKIDSGNGGYNVIHGTDFHQQGEELMFTTHDTHGNEKKIQAKVIDTIEVNMGGGNIENRPVIELDIKFAGEDYKKIPFSVSDRSTNTNPILISKGFVEKELEALIDVGKTNISNDGIDVVYGESFLKGGNDVSIFSPITNTVKGLYNAGKTIAQDGAGIVKGLYNAGKNVVGDIAKLGIGSKAGAMAAGVGALGAGALGLGLWAAAGITKGGIKLVSKLAKKFSSIPTLTVTDAKAIKQRIPTISDYIKVLGSLNATEGTILQNGERSINPALIKMLPIVSFSCQKGIIGSDKINFKGSMFGLKDIPKSALKKVYVQGQKGRAKAWKDQIESARKGIEYLKSQGNKNQEQVAQGQAQAQEQEEELIDTFNEAFTIFLTEADENTSVPNQAQQTEVPNQSQEQQQQTEQPQEEGDTKKQEEIITQFEDLSMFQLWFISLSSDKNAMESVSDTFITKSNFDAEFNKLFESGKVTKDSVGNIIKTISAKIKKFAPPIKSRLAGMWCLAISPDANKPEKRDYHFFQQEPYLIYSNASENKIDTKKVTNAFEQKFPVVKQAIMGLQKAINQDTIGLAKKIISGEAFQNEIKQRENFQELTIAIQKLQKFANQYKEKGYAEEPIIKMIAQKLKETPEIILTPFITEFTYNELNKDDVGHEILQVITNNGQFAGDIKNYNDLINLITKQKQAEQILMKSSNQPNEDEEWIEQKLHSFRIKGLI